jgi:hypothetical protein
MRGGGENLFEKGFLLPLALPFLFSKTPRKEVN